MTSLLLISFFTDDWEYPEHARRLKSECDALGIEHHIEQRESTRDYIQNTTIKPFFIRDCLARFKRPVFWVDVDAIVLKKIEINASGCDIAACQYFNHKLKRDWSVASLYFNNTPMTRRFLNMWCDNSNQGTDEAAFEATWQDLKKEIKITKLPETYNFVRWSYRLNIPEDAVICHQLSKFEDKMKRKINGHLKE